MTKKKILGLAVAAALSLTAVTQTAQAVNIANDGVGELAYIPYYSTKDGRSTYVRLINNGFDTLIVKLKIREGVASQDLRDFYIFLSPRDVWTGNISTNAGGNIRIHTYDTSCTAPSKVDTSGNHIWTAAAEGGWEINIPAGDVGAADEGYIVAHVAGTSETSVFDPFDETPDTNTMVKHVGNDPRNCAENNTAFEFIEGTRQLNAPDKFDILRSQFTEPTNALSAQAAFINPTKATLTPIPVTILANVYNPGINGADGTSGYEESSRSDRPNDVIDIVSLDSPNEKTVSPSSATIFDDATATATQFDLNTGASSLTAALMHSSVMNNIDTTGGSSWIVTFPTKKHQTGNTAPCSDPFVDIGGSSCGVIIGDISETSANDTLQHTVHDKGNISYITNEEESEFATARVNGVQNCFSGSDVTDKNSSACPIDGVATPTTITLPNEVNVITFKGGNPLSSALTTDIPAQYLGNIVYGWMQMRFMESKLDTDTSTLYGAPAIGFGYTEYSASGISTMGQKHSYTSPTRK